MSETHRIENLFTPAITRFARPGDVIVHNHPSGNLEPSQSAGGISDGIRPWA